MLRNVARNVRTSFARVAERAKRVLNDICESVAQGMRDHTRRDLWRWHRCFRPRGVVVGVGLAIPSHVLSHTQRSQVFGCACVPLST